MELVELALRTGLRIRIRLWAGGEGRGGEELT